VNVAAPALADVFETHRRFVWGLCYRLTGSAADADDLVQETFVRAMERPPARTDEPWRPWLVRVATNLGLDLLRKRRRRAYVGPWLPAPIETGDEESPPSYEPVVDGRTTTEGRYDLLESVSFAFLVALEALTPKQRAVLLLRDVFDFSVRETADALGFSPENVKTTHHRARRAMAAYDRHRSVPTRALQERTRRTLEALVAGLVGHDAAAVEAILAADVRTLNDGAGEYHAARKPIYGRARVARFYLKITAQRFAGNFAVRMVNGLPALVGEFHDTKPGLPPRLVLACELDAEGRVAALYAVVASAKLRAMRFAAA
jgi:RNA polymerase sigma-70 factor, ECF subfamily